jgi:lipopolysaccharide/colanic/teichoic acid biosynthesis glycosyltransferase
MATFIPGTPRWRPLLAGLDAVALTAAIWVAHLVRFSRADRPGKLHELFVHPGLVATALLAMWALALAAELYEPLVLRRRHEVTTRVAVVAVSWSLALVLGTYLIPSWRFGRGLLLLTTSCWAVIAWGVRSLLSRRLGRRSRPRALVVGDTEGVGRVCAKLATDPLAPWTPVDGSGVAPAAVADEARRCGAELVVLAGADMAKGGSAVDLAVLLFSGFPVVAASEMWAWLDGRLPVSELSPAAFLHEPRFGAIHWEMFNRLTRVFDVVAGGAMLLLASPLLLVAGAAILFANGRPVLYRQVRAGRFGRPFRLVKLRTMRRDAEADGPAFSSEDDPRVTRLGRVLRRLRLDELPQLVNVLKGDMSLVGPRPERPEFVAELAAAIPFYTFRLAVPPGLTGWAQVNQPYARSEAEHRRKLEYDLYFIRERSLGIYLVTLLRTVSTALVGARR